MKTAKELIDELCAGAPDKKVRTEKQSDRAFDLAKSAVGSLSTLAGLVGNAGKPELKKDVLKLVKFLKSNIDSLSDLGGSKT